MEQLLQIRSIQPKLKLEITDAKLESSPDKLSVSISREKGGLKIENNPGRIRIDTLEIRAKQGLTMKSSAQNIARKGKETAYETGERASREGQMLLRSKVGEGGETLAQIFAQKQPMPTGDFTIGFIPGGRPNITWQEGDFNMSYEADKLKFDVNVSEGNFEFTRGEVNLIIEEYGDVEIEYIGEPMYVPPRDDE